MFIIKSLIILFAVADVLFSCINFNPSYLFANAGAALDSRYLLIVGNMTKQSDKQLLNRIRLGDEEAYKSLYNAYYKRIYSLAFKYLKSRELAEDAVQETFIKLWENRTAVSVNVKGYLFTSARNHVLNMIRNQKKKIVQKIREEHRASLSSNKTEDVILYSEYRTIYNDALNLLTDGKREIFQLKTFHQLTNQEIADKLNISIHTVKSQYYHASKFIKKHLQTHAGIHNGKALGE